MSDARVVADPAGLTAEWLSDALGASVAGVRAEPVGTGQIGTCFRLHLDGPGVRPGGLPSTVLAKLPAADPAARAMMAGVYRSEVRFYTEIADTVDVRAPACFYAEMSPDPDRPGDFTLLLEDLAPREQGDQIAGCTVEQARDAVVNLAGLHAPRWCDPTLLDVEGLTINGLDDAALLAELYGPAVDLFLDGLGPLVSEDDAATLRSTVPVMADWALGRRERFAPMHGDYRLDNLLFPPDGGPGVVTVDWQTLSLGLPARDLAYVLGTGLDSDLRRAHERGLVADHHRALVQGGVSGYDVGTCWDDYRFAMLQGPLVTVFGCAYGTRSERGDTMFAVMLARSCAAIRDLGSLALVDRGSGDGSAPPM